MSENPTEVLPVEEKQQRRLLIVEENKIARKILSREMDSLGAKTFFATSGSEGVLLAQKERPDVITTEINLPEMDGFEMCRKLKSDKATSDIPIIFVTQVDSEKERKKAFSVGASDYYIAPFPRGKLAARIKKLIDVQRDSVKPKTMLVVEDNATIRQIIHRLLKKQGHTVIEAVDGMEAWEILQEKDVDIIISDINMPNMDGLQLCRLVRAEDKWEFVPIIIVSTVSDKDKIAMLLNSGADDYIIKPFTSEEFLARMRAHIRVRDLYNDANLANQKLKNFNLSLEKMVGERTGDLHKANIEAIMMLAIASEFRDTDTGSHVRRIAEYTRKLAITMGYSETKADIISYSSILHDVGKIGIPDSVLKKKGKLTDDEFDLMKAHTAHGESILSKDPFFKSGREVAKSHHERFDGTGYPEGLSEYSIPLVARIVAVADVFDALITERVYKKAWPEQESYEYVIKSSGKQFDPLVVEAFERLYKDGTFSKIRKKHI